MNVTERILYVADVKKELDVSLLSDFALGHGCLFEVKGNSNYQFYSHKFDWLEELLSQLELDSSIIYKVTPISIEEEFALKPITPKERRSNSQLSSVNSARLQRMRQKYDIDKSLKKANRTHTDNLGTISLKHRRKSR